MLLKKGMRGREVTDLQKKLNKIGFRVPICDIFGPKTEKAVKDLQNFVGISPDGVVGKLTSAALDILSGKYRPLLKYGSRDKDLPYVNVLQAMLTKIGLQTPITEMFDSITLSNVRKFQATHNLKVDGIVGKQTWNALLKALELANKVEQEKPLNLPPIKHMIIPKGRKNRKGIKLIKPYYITIHNTANPSVGADAVANAKYILRNAPVSVHFFVDDKQIVQCLPIDEVALHAGTRQGNLQSIGIEICENKDGVYERAEENAAVLTAYLMKKLGVPIDRVVPHKYWSGKNCPHIILARPTGFKSFIEKVKKYL